MSDFTIWCPAVPMETDSEWRMNIAAFGDGYEMRELDGINALNVTFHLDYGLRPQSEVAEMEAYLYARGARSFPFRHPVNGLIFEVFCDSWTVDWSLAQWVNGVRTVYASLTADFRRANGVGVPSL